MVDVASMGFTIDIELTNRCNAKCYFCPRDQTPHQGVMSPEIFDQALARAIEFRDRAQDTSIPAVKVSLCGLGEPLLNRHAPEFVGQVRATDLECMISSNGALLDEKRGQALLDAGLNGILINVGDRDEEYEDVYKLPWEKTRDNVLRFAEMAGDDCRVIIVLVNHHQDSAHIAAMKEFWTSQGLTRFVEFEIMNRGGSLFVDHMQYELYPEHTNARQLVQAAAEPARCVAPFMFQFIGYDGQYYLCCSDWKKEVPLGSVFDRSFADVMSDKLRYVTDRDTICQTCNIDPINRLTDSLRAGAEDQPEPFDAQGYVDEWVEVDRVVVGELGQIDPEIPLAATAPRRRIPVRSV
jgi:MoaA/NifB/PqqE/SkfB family radical SAM enzyme